jgi:hypothetical protein
MSRPRAGSPTTQRRNSSRALVADHRDESIDAFQQPATGRAEPKPVATYKGFKNLDGIGLLVPPR